MNRLRVLCCSSRFHWIAVPTIVVVLAIGIGLHTLSSEASTPPPSDGSSISGTSGAPLGLEREIRRRVGVVQVTTGVEQRTATYPGTTKASQTANLAFRVGGPLIEVEVKPGDRVSKV